MLKFKRRTRFLGFYVQVLAKALQEGLIQTALEWNNDTMGWIIRYTRRYSRYHSLTTNCAVSQKYLEGLENVKDTLLKFKTYVCTQFLDVKELGINRHTITSLLGKLK